ncbi:MAG: DUF1156 domain-containing protein, partial [Candidatus Poribacteria bacterium]
AVLASLLPQWSEDLPQELLSKFPSEESYRAWFLRFLGILGDPVAGRKLIDMAKSKGIRLRKNPYGYKRAFTNNPDDEQLETLSAFLEYAWGTRDITVMDPMAGGGSIPFEALRYGFITYANELNPVASVILKATLDYPARFGLSLADDIAQYGKILAERIEERIGEFFPLQPGERIFAYLWARTVTCPTTGKTVPLSPNWWLQKGSDPVAVRLLCKPDWDECRFEIVRGREAARSKPDEGTVKRGVGRSPWTGEAIDGDYIKQEAQAGRMGQQLYALNIQTVNGKDFRAPTETDLEAVRKAGEALNRLLPRWEAEGLAPIEDIPQGNKTSEPLRYGMYRWADVFSPRQLLSLLMYLEVLNDVRAELQRELSKERVKAVETYLVLAIDKAVDRNSYMSTWVPQRQVIAHTFDRHDFSFKWSYGEFDAAHNLFPWGLDQVKDAYQDIAELAEPAQRMFTPNPDVPPIDRLQVWQGSATELTDVPSESVRLIAVDPPYYDNVMYAECSDFFYVWMKRTLGDVYPEFFYDELTNKDDEAVANVARFASIGGRKKKELAERDYERKMAACFREMHRVLHPDGVLTVMFTHKRIEAWDTLATALIGAGFSIQASWPVHTESEHSLHQARKNAAASTILLVCRKRTDETGEAVWWDDIKGKVRRTAREKAEEFEKEGIRGVDLYISTFGPTLSIISENWPVLTSEVDEKTGKPRQLRPETALDIAREEVVALRKQGLLLGRTVQFDPVTDWYLMAWDVFQAEQFPADEARKLAIALGIDLESVLVREKRIITKKQNFVALQPPKSRRKRNMVDPDSAIFEHLIDAVHTTMLVYQEDGSVACEQFLRRTGLRSDATFKSCLQALINAIPRKKEKGKFVRLEAELLENLRLAFFDDLEAPVEEEPPKVEAQMQMEFVEEEVDEEEWEEEEEEEL